MYPNPKDLQVFVRIYEARSLSAAADALRMTPGMVSKRLSQLERDLGARLFQRTTRQVHPTDEGRRFYAQAQILLETMEGFEREWRGPAEPSGLLRVTASASFARIYLMPLVAKFLNRFPKVHLDLDLTDRRVDIVAEGFDLAIRVDAPADSSLVARRLGSGRRVLCATPAYLKEHGTPRRLEDLRDHACVVLTQYPEWVFERDGKRFTHRPQGCFSTNLGEGMVQAVKAGLGLGVISVWHIEAELKKKSLVPLLPAYPLAEERSIYAIYPSRRHLPLKTLAWLEFLQKNLQVPD